MDIIGTIFLALLIVAPTVYVIVSRVLENRRIKEAMSVESSADSAPVDVSAPELDTLSGASYLKASAGSEGVAAAGGGGATGRQATKTAAAERSGARPATARRAATTRPRGLTYSLSRIERLPPLKRAIVWSELLKPPPGIDPTSSDPLL